MGNEGGRRSSADAISRGLLVGAVTTAGFMLVFGTIGTAIGLGARELTRALPWAGLVIGAALVVAGALVLARGHLRFRVPQLRYSGSAGGLSGDVLFGIGYGTASLSCTLPIFLAATGSAVTGSLAASALSFLAYAAGMGTVLTALAVAASLSQHGLARTLGRLVPYVNRVSGALLLLAGAYVVYYWAFFLLPGSDTRTSGRSLIDHGETFSSRAATWLGSDTGKTVAAMLLAVLGALALVALARRFLGSRPTRESAATGRAAREMREPERSKHASASTRT